MGALISAPLACLTGCGGTCLGMCCAKLAGTGTVENVKASKRMFLGFQAFGLMLILLLRSVGQDWFNWIPGSIGVKDCNNEDSDGTRTESEIEQCWTDQMTYRVSFSMTMIFVILLFLSGIGMQKGALLHYWFAKFAVVPLTVLITLFIPNSAFSWVQDVASIVSILFILAQMMLLLDFGHRWNDHWLSQSLEDQRRDLSASGKRWVAGIIVFAVSFLIFGIAVASRSHVDFNFDEATVIIWVNFTIGALLVILSTWSVIQNGALLPSALVFAFMAFVTWHACLTGANIPSDKNPFFSAPQPEFSTVANNIIGFIFLAVTFGSFVRDPKVFDFSDEHEEIEDSDPESGMGADGEPTVVVNKISTVIFFVIHLFGALYVITLLPHADSLIEFWALAVADWLMLLLFGWSLVAPLVLDRDF